MRSGRWVVLGVLVLVACRPTTADPPVGQDAPTTRTEASGTPTPTPTPTNTPDPTPTQTREAFSFAVSPVAGQPVADRMRGVSWRQDCPLGLESLRYVEVSHLDLDGAVQTGELVVHADVVDDVRAAMRRLFDLEFPIERMRLVDEYGADDDASMRANNTSAFNCRFVAGTTRWSNHAYGTAIDINPLRNPYVRGDRVDPPEAAAFADRTDHRPGMLHPGSPEVAAWTDLGWDWGGAWSSGPDYQHFSATGG